MTNDGKAAIPVHNTTYMSRAKRWETHVCTVKRQCLLKVCRDHAAAKKPKPIAAELGHARAVLTALGEVEGGSRSGLVLTLPV